MQTATCEQSGPDVQIIKSMQAHCKAFKASFTHRGFPKSEAGCVGALKASSCCLQLPWDRIVVANTPTSSNTVAVHSHVDESWQEGQDLLCVVTRNWPAYKDSFKWCLAHWQVRVQCDGVADTIYFVTLILNCCSVGSCSNRQGKPLKLANISMLCAMSKG